MHRGEHDEPDPLRVTSDEFTLRLRGSVQCDDVTSVLPLHGTELSAGETMHHGRDDFEAGRWPDGWAWFEPAPDPTTGLDDELEYLADALRRTVDLRDALCETGEFSASRALALNKVLNAAWRDALARRFGPAYADSDHVRSTRPWHLVVQLRADGRLSRGS